MLEDRHPPGHYRKYPVVQWDLAEERYLQGRMSRLWASCRLCDWDSGTRQLLDTPERHLIEEVIVSGQHWYTGCRGELEFTHLTAQGLIQVFRRRDDPDGPSKVHRKIPRALPGITVLSTFGPSRAEVSQ